MPKLVSGQAPSIGALNHCLEISCLSLDQDVWNGRSMSPLQEE